MTFQITGNSLFVQQLWVDSQEWTSKETSKCHITGPLWGESTGNPVESPHKEPVVQKAFFVTTSSWAVTLTWWRHQMEIFSALLAISAVNSAHKGQWRRALMFSLICTRINGWVNTGEAGDLRHNRAHYDVIVMDEIMRRCSQYCSCWWLGADDQLWIFSHNSILSISIL